MFVKISKHTHREGKVVLVFVSSTESHRPWRWYRWAYVCKLAYRRTSYPKSCTPVDIKKKKNNIKIHSTKLTSCVSAHLWNVPFWQWTCLTKVQSEAVTVVQSYEGTSRLHCPGSFPIPCLASGLKQSRSTTVHKHFLLLSGYIILSAVLTISQKTSARLGAERTSQAASIRWEHWVATPSVCHVLRQDRFKIQITNMEASQEFFNVHACKT